MKTLRIVCEEYDKAGQAINGYSLDVEELSADEFAELRLLLDRCDILEGTHFFPTEPGGDCDIALTIETNNGEQKACFPSDQLSEQCSELISFVKNLSQAYAPFYSVATVDDVSISR